MATGRFARSAELFQRLLSQRPDDPDLLLGVAAALISQDLSGQSLPYWERLVALDGGNPDFNEQLARLYHQLGLPAKARPLVHRLAEPITAPDRLLALVAEVYEALGRNRQADDYWRRLLARDPGHAKAAARLQTYLLARKPWSIFWPLCKMIRATLGCCAGRFRFITIWAALSKPCPTLSATLKSDPPTRQALILALDTYQALDRQAEVLLVLEQMLAMDGELAPDKILRAAILFEQQGQYLRALELYPQILAHFPADAEIMARKLSLLTRLQRSAEIGEILSHPEQRERAWEILVAWHKLDPDDRQVMTALVFAYLERGPAVGPAVPAPATAAAAIEELLAKLAQDGDADPDLLLARATFYQWRDLPYAAWRDYE